MDLPVEHGLLMENLLDLAHAPFTHTGTFAKGWSVPKMVKFLTPAHSPLAGHWDPYPIDMSFEAPCYVIQHHWAARTRLWSAFASASLFVYLQVKAEPVCYIVLPSIFTVGLDIYRAKIGSGDLWPNG